MNLRKHTNQEHYRRRNRALQKTITFLPKYGQIYVSHALCEEFGLKDGVFILFAKDEDTGSWYFTLTDNAELGGFQLHKQTPTVRTSTHGGKKAYHKNALFCARRTFVKLITADIGCETLKCPISAKPKVIDDMLWYKLITNINLPPLHD